MSSSWGDSWGKSWSDSWGALAETWREIVRQAATFGRGLSGSVTIESTLVTALRINREDSLPLLFETGFTTDASITPEWTGAGRIASITIQTATVERSKHDAAQIERKRVQGARIKPSRDDAALAERIRRAAVTIETEREQGTQL